MTVGLTDADELPHAPGGAGWQENWYFLGWDEEAAAGFTFHLQRVPAEGFRELKVAVVCGGQVVSLTRREDDAPTLAGAGWELDPVEPFRRWRLRADLRGVAGRGPMGFVGHGAAGDAPLQLDVDVRPVGPTVDFHEALVPLGIGDDDHYEAGASWTGSLHAAAGGVVARRGLAVRDHTWGRRDYDSLPTEQRWTDSWWTPTVVPARGLFTNALLLRRPGGWVGFGIVADDDGTRVTSDVEVTARPEAAPAGFTATTVRLTDAKVGTIEHHGTVVAHLPVLFPGGGRGRFLNEAMCRVSSGGQPGFAVAEYGNVLGEADLRTVEGALG